MSPQGRPAGIFLLFSGPTLPQALSVVIVLGVSVNRQILGKAPDIHGILQRASEFPKYNGCRAEWFEGYLCACAGGELTSSRSSPSNMGCTVLRPLCINLLNSYSNFIN